MCSKTKSLYFWLGAQAEQAPAQTAALAPCEMQAGHTYSFLIGQDGEVKMRKLIVMPSPSFEGSFELVGTHAKT